MRERVTTAAVSEQDQHVAEQIFANNLDELDLIDAIAHALAQARAEGRREVERAYRAGWSDGQSAEQAYGHALRADAVDLQWEDFLREAKADD